MHECLTVSRRLQFVFKHRHLKLHFLKLCERATSLERKATSLEGKATSLGGKAASLGGKAISLVLRGSGQSNGRRPKYSIQLLQIDFLQHNRKSPSKKLVGRLSLGCSVMVWGLLPSRFLVAGPLSALSGLW